MNIKISSGVLLCLLIVLASTDILAAGPSKQSDSTYYRDNVEGYNVNVNSPRQSRYIDPEMGMILNRGRGQQNNQNQPPQTVLVKHGTRVYCAHCGQFLLDDVKLEEVELRLASNYFDDGITGNDEMANDGLPSNITIKRDVLGEYCVKNMRTLEQYIKKAMEPKNWGYYKDLDESKSKDLRSMPFYSMLLFLATTYDKEYETKIDLLKSENQNLDVFLDQYRAVILQPYYDYYDPINYPEGYPDNFKLAQQGNMWMMQGRMGGMYGGMGGMYGGMGGMGGMYGGGMSRGRGRRGGGRGRGNNSPTANRMNRARGAANTANMQGGMGY